MRLILLLLVVLGVPACGAPARPVVGAAVPVPAAPARHEVRMDDGHALAVWEKSPASPRGAILLVHGRTWSALPNFDLRVAGDDRSVMDALARAGYAAYGVDLRGYGATPRDSTGWLTPERAVRDVAAVLEWIAARQGAGAPRPTLLGYSRGAAVALLTAQRHPDAMSAVVLYAFAADIDADIPADAAAGPPPRRATTAEAAASDFITPASTPRAVVDAYVAQSLATNPVRTDWRGEAEFNAMDPAAVRVPTLLIHGARDPLATVPLQEKVFSRLATPDRAWVILPNADHAAHLEDPFGAWVRAVVDFVERPRR
ncbi:MAG TPA: alpha/beta fold hydrolase [Longimicrobium sp.]|nr:alpha/beta fold hydrolase [Longimicrobium sp.]